MVIVVIPWPLLECKAPTPIYGGSRLWKIKLTSETMISERIFRTCSKIAPDRNAKAEENRKQCAELSHRSQPTLQNQNKQLRVKMLSQDLNPEEIVPSSFRKYPFIDFLRQNEKLVTISLTVENLSVKIDGETILDNISFILRPRTNRSLSDRTIFKQTALIRIDGWYWIEGIVAELHQSIISTKDNSRDFGRWWKHLWLARQFANKEEDDNTFLLRFLAGRMFFSSDEVNKSVNVSSGGESSCHVV